MNDNIDGPQSEQLNDPRSDDPIGTADSGLPLVDKPVVKPSWFTKEPPPPLETESVATKLSQTPPFAIKPFEDSLAGTPLADTPPFKAPLLETQFENPVSTPRTETAFEALVITPPSEQPIATPLNTPVVTPLSETPFETPNTDSAPPVEAAVETSFPTPPVEVSSMDTSTLEAPPAESRFSPFTPFRSSPFAAQPVETPPIETQIVPSIETPPVLPPPVEASVAPSTQPFTFEPAIPVQPSGLPAWGGPTPPAPALPVGTVDLTGETPLLSTNDFSMPPTLFRPADEPDLGTIPVDSSIPDTTSTMTGDTGFDDLRAARARALGEVDPGAEVIAVQPSVTTPSTYKAWPSLTLFVFRIIIATVLSIRATQQLIHLSDTQDLWRSSSILPQPEMIALIQIGLGYAIAFLVLIGAATRVAGILLSAMSIALLTFLVWGASNPFVDGMAGFGGEYEILMLAIGLLFAGIGAGRAAIDGAVHQARLEKKAAKAELSMSA